MNNQPQQNQIQIKATDEKLKGEYANMMNISHTPSEVVLDFINIFPANNIFPATGDLKQRIIVSPSHFKQMIDVMKNVLNAYEKQFGKVAASEAPSSAIGFQPKE